MTTVFVWALMNRQSKALKLSNSQYCKTPLTKNEVIHLFNANYTKCINGELNEFIKDYVKLQKVFWHRNHMARGQMKSLIKAEVKKQMVYDAIETLMDGQEIKYARIYRYLDWDAKTLRKYWTPEF